MSAPKNPSKVFFVGPRARSHQENKAAKLKKLFKAAGLAAAVPKGALTAVKLHFGEPGNDSHVSPVLTRAIVEEIVKAGGKPFLTDTNTLYSGGRHNAVDHLNAAHANGFTPSVAGAPVIIADGLKSGSTTSVRIKGKHFKTAHVATDIVAADALIALSHFKGHMMAGFGGTVKNLAMGCAPRLGKQDQHCVRFGVDQKKCKGCAKCRRVCPQGAVTVTAKKASIDKTKCVGCGECLTVCADGAVSIDWATEIGGFMERMAEYALAAVTGKKGRVGFFNFLLNITPDCDCVPFSDAAVVPDIGILASKDPVALDQASFDLVNAQAGAKDSQLACNHAPGEDKFKGLWSYTDGGLALDACEALGLGTRRYELVDLD